MVGAGHEVAHAEHDVLAGDMLNTQVKPDPMDAGMHGDGECMRSATGRMT